MKYYYLDLNKETVRTLYDKVCITDEIEVSSFTRIKIQEIDKKFQDKNLLIIGLPLKNQSTKEILTVLEENNLDFEINTHHN